ncbi:hypothetical protein [Actinomadura barringtoniae]|nr:hypothetical protein [Actinomadura barringtoniae]
MLPWAGAPTGCGLGGALLAPGAAFGTAFGAAFGPVLGAGAAD